MPSLDGFINKATISVDTTANGTDLLTAAEQSRPNMQAVAILSSQDIYLVDGTNGTASNSPFLISANALKIVQHNVGPLKAIASSATATVRVAVITGHH